MSSLDISLLLRGIDRYAAPKRSEAPLRLVLCAGEVSRLPRRAGLRVRVLAGTAWISQAGADLLLCAGRVATLVSTRDFPVIGAVGSDALLFEVI